jgi:hypothetical protein
MKMTWRLMEFSLIFSPADGQALWQLCRPKRLLTLLLGLNHLLEANLTLFQPGGAD